MKKFFLSLAVFVMALCANAQTNQYFWYNGNLMMGNPIAQIDSVTFGEGESADTLHILLPRTIIKEVHDTVYITIHDTVCPTDVPEGALAGEFSVSPTKKVRFSKGNLQYQASTNTWRFADNQWNFVGNDDAGNVYENSIKCDNSLIGSTYNGWIDLFGWGTGNSPTKISSDNTNDYTIFSDWGNNVICNGGNIINIWRTLNKEEWGYLFLGRENASILFGLGSIEGINGLILLPDSWSNPEGVSFNPSTTMGLTNQGNYFTNSTGDNFTHNTYTFAQWADMELAGAIFLPAAGAVDRFENDVYSVNSRGFYWTTTSYEPKEAYNLRFYSDELSTIDISGRSSGVSVRLVQDIE